MITRPKNLCRMYFGGCWNEKFVLKSIPFYFASSSTGVPDSRNPSGHVMLVVHIGDSKPSLQSGFLRHKEVDVIDDDEQCTPSGQGGGTEEERFADQHRGYGSNHWVANVAIRPHGYESLRRIPRGKSALTYSGEQRNAPGE